MLKASSFHTNSHAETFAPLINCVINDALLEMMPDIDQALAIFLTHCVYRSEFLVRKAQYVTLHTDSCSVTFDTPSPRRPVLSVPIVTAIALQWSLLPATKRPRKVSPEYQRRVYSETNYTSDDRPAPARADGTPLSRDTRLTSSSGSERKSFDDTALSDIRQSLSRAAYNSSLKLLEFFLPRDARQAQYVDLRLLDRCLENTVK